MQHEPLPGAGDVLWTNFIALETSLHLGDLASIAGVALSIVGFSITIFGVLSSRKAAERAEAAAKAAVLRIRVFDEMVNLTAAITTLDEIRRFHRIRQWPLLPDRYAALRRTLISIKTTALDLTDAQRDTVQSALVTLQSIERAVERGMKEPLSLDGAMFNNLLAREADGLLSILNELRFSRMEVDDGEA